jgi:arsenate reductase (glutaredoxin)
VLITILGPISGAHFNPAVSLVFALKRDLAAREAAFYVGAQVAGGVLGTIAAHVMFALPLLDASMKVRTGGAQWFAEWVATFGLVVTILAGGFARAAVPWLVGLYITAAYWFTASTSFANPAVAIARAFTNAFSGIRPIDLPGFIAAQLLGALCALAFAGWLLREEDGAKPLKAEAQYDGNDLSQPRLRHDAQHAGDDPPSGEEPVIIEYLKTPPTRAQLQELIAAMGISVRALLREKGTPYAELGLADPKWTADELLDFMMAYPILMNRPIVVTPKGVRLCRPSEAVLDTLPNPDIGRFAKEDGDVVEFPHARQE